MRSQIVTLVINKLEITNKHEVTICDLKPRKNINGTTDHTAKNI